MIHTCYLFYCALFIVSQSRNKENGPLPSKQGGKEQRGGGSDVGRMSMRACSVYPLPPVPCSAYGSQLVQRITRTIEGEENHFLHRPSLFQSVLFD